MSSYKLTETPNFNDQGWCQNTGMTDHTILMKYVSNMEESSLDFVRRDCREAAAALPGGWKAGYYEDMAHYCSMRIRGLMD